MNAPLKPSPHTATLPTISGLPACLACFCRWQTLSVGGRTIFASSTFRGVEVGDNRALSRLRAGLLALAITTLVVVLPITRARADSVDLLANLTGASTSTCQS